MSNVLRGLVALGLMGFVAGCANSQPEEVTYEVVQPVVAEPKYTKY